MSELTRSDLEGMASTLPARYRRPAEELIRAYYGPGGWARTARLTWVAGQADPETGERMGDGPAVVCRSVTAAYAALGQARLLGLSLKWIEVGDEPALVPAYLFPTAA